MPRAKPSTPRDKRTAAELREESRRCREAAIRTADLLLKRMLARRALEFALLAEGAERDDLTPNPNSGERPAPAPRKR